LKFNFNFSLFRSSQQGSSGMEQMRHNKDKGQAQINFQPIYSWKFYVKPELEKSDWTEKEKKKHLIYCTNIITLQKFWNICLKDSTRRSYNTSLAKKRKTSQNKMSFYEKIIINFC